MANTLGMGSFLSRFGLEKVWENLEKSGYSTHATVATDLHNGDIRSLLLRGKTLSDGTHRIRLKYFSHDVRADYNVRDILELKFKGTEDEGVALIAAKLEGQSLNLSDPELLFSLGGAVKKFSDHITRLNEWVNPIQVINNSGLPREYIGKAALPNLYLNGDFKSSNTNDSEPYEPVYPALFLPALIGAGADNYAGLENQTHSLTIYGEGEPKQSGVLQYRYSQGKTYRHMDMRGNVERHTPDDSQSAELYKIETKPVKNSEKYARITKLEYMGEKIDLKNQQAVAAVLKVIRNTNRTIRAESQALIDDLKKPPHERRYALPSELSLFTGAYKYLNQPMKMPRDGIMSLTAVGGANRRQYVSGSDTHIGANQNVVGYEYVDDDGSSRNENIMFDAGVLFHEIFNVSFFNAARFLHHKTDKAHKPDQPVQAIFLTHVHEDHTGQLAYLAKKGYKLPVLIMNPMTKRKIKRDLDALNIKSPLREEILEKCHTVDLRKDVNPQDPHTKTKTEIAGTTIEQWTEKLPGKKLGSFEYYPIMQIGSFKLRIGPMQHSAPGLTADVITPAGSIRITGDGKNDETSQVDLPPLDVWMKAFAPDAILIDCTGANREEPNPLERDVEASILHELQKAPDKRFIFPLIGSNKTRLCSLIAALGQTDRKTLIIDGKAVEDLVKDADHAKDLKAWAKREHGVDILMRTEKKKVRPFLDDPSRNGEYAILATGTQDEPLSSINRAARNANDPDRYSLTKEDIICFLQGCIPIANNQFRRWNFKAFVENFHGAQVILTETIKKEGEPSLKHSSGHNDPKGIKTFIRNSRSPTALLTHGNGEQLDAGAALAKEEGANFMHLLPSTSLRIKRGKEVSPYKIVPSELIGVTLHTPSPEKFYLKGRFATAVMPIKPELDTPIAKLIDGFEECVRGRAGRLSPFELARVSPIDLSRSFNAQTVNGFLTQNMPFGIDKYRGDVFTAKNINALGFLDTETGGLDARYYRTYEFSMTVQNARRELLEDIQLFQQIPDEFFPSASAMLVTNVDPSMLDEGLPAHEFVWEMDAAIKSIKAWSLSIAKESDEDTKMKDVKAISVAHNMRYDARMMAEEKGLNLDMDSRTHQTRGIIALDTRTISRALAAFRPKDYVVPVNEETGLPNHRLEALCVANDIDVDAGKTHGAAYDTNLCADLFWKQYDIAPDIVSQMIINADSSTSHLLNDMIGMDTGFGGPHPVFSYVSPSAKRPKAQMGCVVATLQSDRYAVVFNLKYDPNEYMHLPASKITEMLTDPSSDVFEILDFRKQPVVMPARMGFRVQANGDIPKETLDRRAGVVKRHINYVDPHANWKTIAQKIDEAWKTRQKDVVRRIERSYSDDPHENEPNYFKSLAKMPGADLSPHKGVSVLRQLAGRRASSNTAKNIHRHIREYRKALHANKRSEAKKHYKTLLKKYRAALGPAVDTINYVHYKLYPQDLLADDRARTESMIATMTTTHYRQFKAELEQLKNDPALWEKYIGDDKNKQDLFHKLCAWRDEHTHYDHMTDGARHLIHPWANDSRPEHLTYHNDNDRDPDRAAREPTLSL